MKGLVYRQCYVMHPGVPVLVLLTELISTNGWAQFTCFNYASSLKHEENAQDAQLLFPKAEKQWLTFYSGKEQFGMREYYKHTAAKINDADAYMQVVHLSKCLHSSHMNNAIVEDSFLVYSQIADLGSSWLPPQFLLFSEHLFDQDSLSALLSLKFSEV